MERLAPLVSLVLIATLVAAHAVAADKAFRVDETSIADIHRAFQAKRLTCHQLVELYLHRIEAYDRQAPALRAMLYINPDALKTADALDVKFRTSGLSGPLHCIPIVLKDNYDTADMPTTAGSKALADLRPEHDAFVVARLRQAGAVILGKTNLHELALAGTTVSSLGGQTLNPYDLSRTPGGSSGGTGAAVAANFAVAGTGSDTVNSIRSPASANSLVGIRPTRGLLSRAGIVPVSETQDAVGPIARSVADAARLLSVMAGYDPADPSTAWSVGNVPQDYAPFLKKDGLRGARIGVLRTMFGTGPEHAEVNRVMAAALAAMQRQGATLVEVDEPALEAGKLIADNDVQKYEFKVGFNAYLAGLGARAPVKTLAEFLQTGAFHKPSLEKFLLSAQGYENPSQEPDYKDRLVRNMLTRQTLMTVFASQRLDAVVYPLQKRLVVPLTESNQADRTGILASVTGFPAITVPAGFSTTTEAAPLGVPVGLDLLGRPWSEPTLLKLAYAFEQATHVRRPPRSAPPLGH
jgi:Asp-tRNA(Asn)/Glu-tRNA(Gln) amidotransferase A subunit family amidase